MRRCRRYYDDDDDDIVFPMLTKEHLEEVEEEYEEEEEVEELGEEDVDIATQHCVRCHEDFTLNRFGSCIIPHVFNEADPHVRPSGLAKDKSRDVLWYDSECCGSSITIQEDERGSCGEISYAGVDDIGFCFIGRHTTSEEEVKYNDVNVLPCLSNGNWSPNCNREPGPRFRPGRPVFSYELDDMA